jgi:ABC-type sugar transport system permease subunit
MPDTVRAEFALDSVTPRAMRESRLRRFFHSGGATPYLLVLPSLVIVLFVVAVPLGVSLWSSFTPYNLVRPWTLHHSTTRTSGGPLGGRSSS